MKKGEDSVGPARQYWGTCVKVDNCQVGVFAAYTFVDSYALMDNGLYIPKQWFSDGYRLKRTKYKLSAEIKFKTKPQMTVAILGEIA